MASISVLSFEERYGILFFVSNCEDNYVFDVFVMSMILPRFRHHGQYRYINDFVAVIPGSRHYVLVILEYENIFLDEHNGVVMIRQNYARRISFVQIVALIMFQFSTAGILYNLVMHVT